MSGGRGVLEGLAGIGVMAGALVTPGRRARRARWGLDAATAARGLPGDALVPAPRSHWTHGVEIDALAEEVWPWVAQVGADRGGFYSYEWLENLVGCVCAMRTPSIPSGRSDRATPSSSIPGSRRRYRGRGGRGPALRGPRGG
jgi:hypothetical protein